VPESYRKPKTLIIILCCGLAAELQMYRNQKRDQHDPRSYSIVCLAAELQMYQQQAAELRRDLMSAKASASASQQQVRSFLSVCNK